MGRICTIRIPVRPKAVQSVRFGGRGCFVDRRVREWKAQILPYIKAAAPDSPFDRPIRINYIRYIFKMPQSTPKRMAEYVRAGGLVPYVGTADITDNLAKGLVDTCAGIVFTNDKLIWRTVDIMKVYGVADGIEIQYEETPDVLDISGKGYN